MLVLIVIIIFLLFLYMEMEWVGPELMSFDTVNISTPGNPLQVKIPYLSCPPGFHIDPTDATYCAADKCADGKPAAPDGTCKRMKVPPVTSYKQLNGCAINAQLLPNGLCELQPNSPLMPKGMATPMPSRPDKSPVRCDAPLVFPGISCDGKPVPQIRYDPAKAVIPKFDRDPYCPGGFAFFNGDTKTCWGDTDLYPLNDDSTTIYKRRMARHIG